MLKVLPLLVTSKIEAARVKGEKKDTKGMEERTDSKGTEKSYMKEWKGFETESIQNSGRSRLGSDEAEKLLKKFLYLEI